MELFNDIFETDIEIPISTKIGLLIAVIIMLITVYFVMKDGLRQTYGESVKWYFIIFLINLVNILLVMFYYKVKEGKFKGRPGLKGDEGSRGKFGKFLKCTFCDKNIYLKKTKDHKLIATLNYPYYEHEKMINKLMGVSTTKHIDFTNINIKTTEKKDSKINKLLINNLPYAINVWASHHFSRGYPDQLGTFYRSGVRKGYSIIGDIVLGVYETKKRNAFVASGTVPISIKLPVDYHKIITIHNKYTIWKPIAPPGFVSLGDIIEEIGVKPRNDLLYCVPEKCVSITHNLTLVTIGYLPFDNQNYSKSFGKYQAINESKFVKEGMKHGTGFFSLWRTPLNTFITEYHIMGSYLNGESLFYNIVNGNPKFFNKNGKPSKKMMSQVRNKLKSAILPTFLVKEIVREYRIEFSGAHPGQKNIQKYIYDISDKSISDKTNLYELLNMVFPGGFDYIINIDENVTDDSLRLLPIQSILLEITRHLFAPRRTAYIIKNECLAYTRFDQDRLKLIREVRNAINRNNQLQHKFRGGDETCNNWSLVNVYQQNFINRLNRTFRFIPKWHDKIFKDKDYEDFTNSRLEFLLKELKKYNDFINVKCAADKDVDLEEIKANLKSEIERYRRLYNTYLSNPQNCANRRYVEAHESELKENLARNLKMILNHRYKLENMQFHEFTPAMLKYATDEYQIYNNQIHKKCEK